MRPVRYLFNGEWVTAPELSQKVTAWSLPWLRKALDAGCKTTADLHARSAKHQQNMVQGAIHSRQGRKA